MESAHQHTARPAIEPDTTQQTLLQQTLIHRICSMTSLEPAMAQRLIAEVLHFFDETSEDFIIRRHRELQQDGFSNSEIYKQIEAELGTHRFANPPLSLRQIRRVIYG